MKRIQIASAFAAIAWTITPAASLVNTAGRPASAIHGYDAVAYFTEGRPVEGVAGFSFDWNGAVWRFSSREHRNLFAADPARYAPQYGGYCAWAVSRGYTADIDPLAWRIVENRLYLNYSLGVRSKWEADIPGHISKANANWPRVLDK